MMVWYELMDKRCTPRRRRRSVKAENHDPTGDTQNIAEAQLSAFDPGQIII